MVPLMCLTNNWVPHWPKSALSYFSSWHWFKLHSLPMDGLEFNVGQRYVASTLPSPFSSFLRHLLCSYQQQWISHNTDKPFLSNLINIDINHPLHRHDRSPRPYHLFYIFRLPSIYFGLLHLWPKDWKGRQWRYQVPCWTIFSDGGYRIVVDDWHWFEQCQTGRVCE